MKTLILYYSYEGTTKNLVDTLEAKFDFEVERIEVENEKEHKGLVKYIWGGRQVVQKKEPQILDLKHNLEDYDRIIIGTPVWASSFTPAIRTLLNKNLLENKEVAYFCTDKGGKGHTFEDFDLALVNSKIIGRQEFINVRNKKEESNKKLIDWINTL